MYNSAQRPMVQGNWTCAGCSKEITELPFEPREGRDIFCRDCHKSRMGDRPARRDDRPRRQMFQGNWSCASCGNAITELPFEPRNTDNLKCRDCFRK